MSSEWMKVMLDEIARKKTEAEQADAEAALRAAEHVAEGAGSPPPEAPGDTHEG